MTSQHDPITSNRWRSPQANSNTECDGTRYEEDATLFRFLGGRLLSSVFPQFPATLSGELFKLVTTGTPTDADFVLAVMENYHGEPATHDVLKAIVARYPLDQARLSHVRASFDNTGVVSGAFGFVDAMRQKKALIDPWLSDPVAVVREFAEKHRRDLDLRIADEQRRAEEMEALRHLD